MPKSHQSATVQSLRQRVAAHPYSALFAGVGLIGLVWLSVFVWHHQRLVKPAEASVFHAINGLPDWLGPIFIVITDLGTLGAVIAAGVIALIRRKQRIGLAIIISGASAWFVTDVVKDLAGRVRPSGLLTDVIVRYTSLAAGNGYPSGHTAVATAVAMSLALIVGRRWIWLLLLLPLAVGMSRIYLGVHLPLDVLGGWCVGLVVGFLSDLVLHVEHERNINKI